MRRRRRGKGGPVGGSSRSTQAKSMSDYKQKKKAKKSEEVGYGPSDPIPPNANNEGLVIDVGIKNYIVRRAYVASGIAVSILHYNAFQALKLQDSDLVQIRTPLSSVSDPFHIKGLITLDMTIGKEPKSRTLPVNFVVVDGSIAYNVIIGRPVLSAIGAVISTVHVSMKFPTPEGVAEVRGDIEAARACYAATIGRGQNC